MLLLYTWILANNIGLVGKNTHTPLPKGREEELHVVISSSGFQEFVHFLVNTV